jgi:hypothetical protein
MRHPTNADEALVVNDRQPHPRAATTNAGAHATSNP